MKELTVCIQNEYEGKVIYRTELYTEEEYKKLEEENKKLKEEIKRLEFDVDAWHQLKLLLEGEKLLLGGEIERLRGLQICGKTVAERIEEDKKVVRE